MTEKTTARLVLPSDSRVLVELPNSARRTTRFVTRVGSRTVRPALDLLARGGERLGASGVVHPKRLFRISSSTDAPAAILAPPRGTRRRMVHFDDFRAEWLWHRDLPDPLETQDSVLLYFHGGGYASCGLNTHRRLVAKIARGSGMAALNVDYRQLPVHFTQTLEDAVTAYRHLLDLGFDARRIILGGDSAGGGLAFRLAQATRERELPMPGGIIAIAPWADLNWTVRNAHPNVTRDCYLPASALEWIARWGIGIDGALDPRWSAVENDCTGMPPALIQVGSTECLLPDAEQLAQRYAEANAPLRLQLWDHAPHVFQAASDLLTDARDAIRELTAFNRELLGGALGTDATDPAARTAVA